MRRIVMLDTSLVFAPHLALALAADRERVAESRKWLRDLRDIEARERAQVRTPREVTVSKPGHLAGTHKL
jgi:hypothetical protein